MLLLLLTRAPAHARPHVSARPPQVRISPSAERLLEAGRNGTAQLMQPQQ